MKPPYKEIKKKFPFITREEYKAMEIELPTKRETAAKAKKKLAKDTNVSEALKAYRRMTAAKKAATSKKK